MKCTRCEGLLVKDWMFTASEYDSSRPYVRCVNCGHCDDPVFTSNRRAQYVSERVISNGRCHK